MVQPFGFRHAFFKLLLGWLGAASVAAVAAPAHAADGRRGPGSTQIAVDFDFSTAVDEPSTSSGGGGALRVGRKFDLLLVSLTPEIGGGYHGFGGDYNAKIYSAFVGGRLGVGKILEPSVFGHVGVARLDGAVERTAPVLDAGLALDFTLLPLIDLGVHGSYNVLMPRDDGSALKFFILGAHAALVF